MGLPKRGCWRDMQGACQCQIMDTLHYGPWNLWNCVGRYMWGRGSNMHSIQFKYGRGGWYTYTRRHDMEMTWHVSIHLWISCRSHSFKRGQAAPRHHDTKIEWGAGQAPASPLNLFIRSCHYKTCAAACNMLKMWQTQRHIEFKLDHVVEHFGAV